MNKILTNKNISNEVATLVVKNHGIEFFIELIDEHNKQLVNAITMEDFDGTVVVPEGITRIKDDTFNSMGLIKFVILPNSLEEIGERAFAYCVNLVAITIPTSVREIGVGAFTNCTELASVDILPNRNTFFLGGYIFEACTNLKYLTIYEQYVNPRAFEKSHLECIYFANGIDIDIEFENMPNCKIYSNYVVDKEYF